MTVNKFEFKHSLKNVPIPSNETYMKTLISKTEDFIQRLRWKAFFFLNPPDPNKPKNNNFGFKTTKNAPPLPELTPFEADLSHLIANLEFSEHKSSFQKSLDKDIKSIKRSPNVFVKADKTHNIYEVDKIKHNELMSNNITAQYKKVDHKTVENIDAEAKSITNKLNISDRVEKIAQKNAFITIKDHKPQFPNDIKCRLINPTKSNIGKISKQLLDIINATLITKLDVKILKNSAETIEWFKETEFKPRKSFLQFDIVDYYPSMSKKTF